MPQAIRQGGTQRRHGDRIGGIGTGGDGRHGQIVTAGFAAAAHLDPVHHDLVDAAGERQRLLDRRAEDHPVGGTDDRRDGTHVPEVAVGVGAEQVVGQLPTVVGLNTLVRTGPFVAKRWRALDSSTPTSSTPASTMNPPGPSQGLLVPCRSRRSSPRRSREAAGPWRPAWRRTRSTGWPSRPRSRRTPTRWRAGRVQNLRPQPVGMPDPMNRRIGLCSLISKPGARTTSRIIVHVGHDGDAIAEDLGAERLGVHAIGQRDARPAHHGGAQCRHQARRVRQRRQAVHRVVVAQARRRGRAEGRDGEAVVGDRPRRRVKGGPTGEQDEGEIAGQPGSGRYQAGRSTAAGSIFSMSITVSPSAASITRLSPLPPPRTRTRLEC